MTERLNSYDKDLLEVPVEYDQVHSIIEAERVKSLEFLKNELEGYSQYFKEKNDGLSSKWD